MAKRKTKPQIRVGECAVMREGQMMSYARSEAGRVVAKEGNTIHVRYHGESKPKVFNQDIFMTVPCPVWLAGVSRRRPSKKRR